MPYYFIRSVNSEFQSRDEGAEYDLPETALELGLRGAALIAAEEIDRGIKSVAVEIVVEREDNSQVLRSVLAMSVSDMMIVGEASGASDRPLSRAVGRVQNDELNPG